MCVSRKKIGQSLKPLTTIDFKEPFIVRQGITVCNH
jgi:hypothetical protein